MRGFWCFQSELEEEVEEASAAAVAADPLEAAAMSQAATHLHNLYAPKPPHYEVSFQTQLFFVSHHRDSANRSASSLSPNETTKNRPDLLNKTPNTQAQFNQTNKINIIWAETQFCYYYEAIDLFFNFILSIAKLFWWSETCLKHDMLNIYWI